MLLGGPRDWITANVDDICIRRDVVVSIVCPICIRKCMEGHWRFRVEENSMRWSPGKITKGAFGSILVIYSRAVHKLGESINGISNIGSCKPKVL